MLIYLYFDALDQLEPDVVDFFNAELVPALKDWHQQQDGISLLVDSRDVDLMASFQRNNWDLGLLIETQRAKPLKKLLNYLNKLCQKHQQVIAVGIWDESQQSCEDVCFFGYEEAEADLFEIASYLGLKF